MFEKLCECKRLSLFCYSFFFNKEKPLLRIIWDWKLPFLGSGKRVCHLKYTLKRRACAGRMYSSEIVYMMHSVRWGLYSKGWFASSACGCIESSPVLISKLLFCVFLGGLFNLCKAMVCFSFYCLVSCAGCSGDESKICKWWTDLMCIVSLTTN